MDISIFVSFTCRQDLGEAGSLQCWGEGQLGHKSSLGLHSYTSRRVGFRPIAASDTLPRDS
jgi:hypothetical protein